MNIAPRILPLLSPKQPILPEPSQPSRPCIYPSCCLGPSPSSCPTAASLCPTQPSPAPALQPQAGFRTSPGRETNSWRTSYLLEEFANTAWAAQVGEGQAAPQLAPSLSLAPRQAGGWLPDSPPAAQAAETHAVRSGPLTLAGSSPHQPHPYLVQAAPGQGRRQTGNLGLRLGTHLTPDDTKLPTEPRGQTSCLRHPPNGSGIVG